MDLPVITNSGKDTGRKVKLEKKVFGIEPNDHAIYLDIKQYLANQRQGTHKSKERSEIAGSTRKIKRQKGTGTARFGSIKNPIFKGGGRVFGPKPRDYSFKLNKKVKKLARKSALSYKFKDKSLAVIEDFTFEAPKTKQYLKMLNDLALMDKKTLLVIPGADQNVVKSGKNLRETKVILAAQINTYDILNADSLLLLEGTLPKINELLK